METKESRKDIRFLFGNEVFVFGSNRAGRHGRGAAKLAVKFGAVMGKGEGYYGRTYGIPTKDRKLKVLTLGEIELAINRFIKHAKKNPDMSFQVTEIGCGLAGYKPKHIAPFFKESLELENVKLPKRFLEILQSNNEA